jgi:hypothetical protein
MQYDHVIVGLAGESHVCYDAGKMTDKYKGIRVYPKRACLNQPTTICVTEDGRKLWVMNDGFKRVVPKIPEVGTGVFWCGCMEQHEDRHVSETTVFSLLSHIIAVHKEALKMPKDIGFDEEGYLRDRTPDITYKSSMRQVSRMKRYPTTGLFCTEAKTAAYCVAMGWLEFNDSCTGVRITEAGLDEEHRLLKKITKDSGIVSE